MNTLPQYPHGTWQPAKATSPAFAPSASLCAEGDTLWFCTATNKDVYHQLQQNPKFELSAWKPGRGWIIVTGVADLNDTAGDEVAKQATST